jgi:ribosomal protein S18 acetylase RimI-like enzyme
MSITIRPIQDDEDQFCEKVLRALPDWFGIESAIVHYVEQTTVSPTWIAEFDNEPAGFLTIKRHSDDAAEIECMAVLPQFHRRGIGRAMVGFIEQYLRDERVRFLQVKTVSPARDNAEYALTRRFYEAVGFVPLEDFPDLWPGNPCRQYIKFLGD